MLRKTTLCLFFGTLTAFLKILKFRLLVNVIYCTVVSLFSGGTSPENCFILFAGR